MTTKNGKPTCPCCYSNSIIVVWVSTLNYCRCNVCDLNFIYPFIKPYTNHSDFLNNPNAKSSVTDPGYIKMMINNSKKRGIEAFGMAKKRCYVYTKYLKRKPINILEIGPGEGAFADGYKKLDIPYTGVDIDHKLSDFAQSLGRKVLYGGPDILIGLQKFDVISMSQVLEHIFDPRTFLKVLHPLLCDDGVIHIDVPNHNGILPTLRKLKPKKLNFGFLEPQHHQIAYTKKSLLYLITVSGFSPIFIKPKSNLDKTYGQLVFVQTIFAKFRQRLAGYIGMGSFSVCLAKKQKPVYMQDLDSASTD